jgi:tetratricopeptide (TPR) repeat protein
MRAAPIALVAVSLVALICRLHAQADIVQKTRLDPDYQQGKAALYAGRYAEAKHYFELAEARIGTNSAEINAGLALAELQLGLYPAARQHEIAVLELVTDNHARAEAYNTIGSAWVREARQTGSTDQLRAAEQSFREATKADPGFAASYYDLGELLLHQNRGSEAATAFKDFVRLSADDPTLIRDMPVQRLGRAPDFAAVDISGKTVSSASLRGRVVLLDFWATWCPPCLRALPVMRELSHYLPSDLSVISIDEDSTDAEVWKRFVAQQSMDWTQVWDQSSSLYRTLGLGAPTELSLPRYILIDREGYVLRVYGGTDRLGSVAGHAIKLARNVANPDHRNLR